MQQKFGIQVNSKAEADLIAAALESYVAANPQARTVIFADMMRRLSVLQNNLGKIEDVESKKKQREELLQKHQNEMQKKHLPRGNPLPPIAQKKQSIQVQQRNQKIVGQQNLPRR